MQKGEKEEEVEEEEEEEEVVGGVVGWAAADCYDGYRNNPR